MGIRRDYEFIEQIAQEQQEDDDDRDLVVEGREQRDKEARDDATDLRTQLEKAFKASKEEPAKEEAPAAGTDRGDGRDASGKFAKKDGSAADDAGTRSEKASTEGKDTASGEAKPTEVKADEQQGKAEEKAQAPVAGAPPVSWRSESKAKWAELPEWAQAEIAKREGDIHKQATKYDEERTFGREVNRAIQPYMGFIRAEGATPAQAIGSLMETARILRVGTPEQKRNAVLGVVRQFNIDIGQPQGGGEGGGGQQPPLTFDPNTVRNLAREEFDAREQATLQAQIEHELQAFASDPANVYFEQVKTLMGPLIGSGRAPDLKTAYQLACNADPDVRASIEAQQRAADAQKRAKEEQQRQQEARRRAISLQGSPGLAIPAGKKANGELSIREILEQQFSAARGGGI